MIIELKGVEFNNKGSALMLLALVTKLREQFPDIEFAISHNDKTPKDMRKQIASYRKVTLRKMYIDLNVLTYLLPHWCLRWFKRRGIVFEGHLHAIIDASGFSYSDQWGPYMSIRHLAGELSRCHRFNKPYIFMPQAFGPFSQPNCREYLASTLPLAALIYARDQQSYQYIQAITSELPQLHLMNDFTNSVAATEYRGLDKGETRLNACIIPNFNMLSSRNHENGWMEQYIPTVLHIINAFHLRGYSTFFLNHEGASDAAIIDQINAELPTTLPVIAPKTAQEVKNVIAASQVVFSSRFHGCISALSSGVPCLGSSWSHKYEALYDDYGIPDLLISPNMTGAELDSAITSALAPATLTTITQQAANQALKTQQMWNEVFAVLSGQLES